MSLLVSTSVSSHRDEMILILLLITTISCVCGTFFVKVTQTDYQAEENDSVTLEWTFTNRSDKSPNLLMILCKLVTDHRVSVVYQLHDGVEDPELQDEQFSGRVQCDRDVLREGRLRLHVSRLRTEDSGQYKCVVRTRYGQSADKCRLNVTATVAQEHTTTTVNPEPLGQERFSILLGALIMTAVIILVITVGKAAAAAGRKVANVVIRVIVVIAAVVVVVVYSIAVVTATAPAVAVLGLLLGGSIILSVFAALSAPWVLIYSGFSHSNSESGPDSISSYRRSSQNDNSYYIQYF
ncbi:uncharacterized protein LOC117751902 isoform X2 [Hippoglossus hippoglossus]|uniref:uncharacterized protein LOC117751902 isoform X2 n=1 Tax=Hippoglossus hippoglossus TaxID=8267 RepID=UPI00148D3B34|nr:uncharacterized protein LOC117751902 isoform X2 [Hippoglossus hippoglossus]